MNDQCSPNPCANRGTCKNDEDGFFCVCDGTGYGGPFCNLLIIHLEYIPPITTSNETIIFPVTLFTTANLIYPVKVVLKFQRFVIKVVRILYGRVTINVTGRRYYGLSPVKLSSSKNVLFQPKYRMIIISDIQNTSYFQQLNLTRGQLRSECCTPDTN